MKVSRVISVPVFFVAAFFLLDWLIEMRAVHGMPLNSFQSLGVFAVLAYLAYVIVSEKTHPTH